MMSNESLFMYVFDDYILLVSCLVLVLLSVALLSHAGIGGLPLRRTEFRKSESMNKHHQPSPPLPSKNKTTCPDTAAAIQRKQDFLERVGQDYGYRNSPAGFIDAWRSGELPVLVPSVDTAMTTTTTTTEKQECEVYLDFAGAALPWQSQLQASARLLSLEIHANPHSTGPAAERTARRMEQVKKRILDWLDAHPAEQWAAGLPHQDGNNTDDKNIHAGYEIVFTSGTTQAMQIIAERIAWQGKCRHCQQSSQFVYPVEAHTSLVGMRGLALRQGASFHCLPTDQLVFELDRGNNENPPWLHGSTPSSCPHCPAQVPNLLAMPLECNFGGTRIAFSSSWAQKLSKPGRPWWSLLDIAKAASTGPVSLRELNPDFACLSFYKVFGSPTGLGCLLVKRSIVDDWLVGDRTTLKTSYQGGGSVDLLLPRQNITYPRSSPSRLAFINSGTCHFRGILELSNGFDVLDRLGGMATIHRHASCLARELACRLRSLKHVNHAPVVTLYGAWGEETALERNNIGQTLAFNVRRQDGSYVGFNEVAKLAALNRPCPIQLRVGCVCNPGACQQALEMSEDRVLDNYRKRGHVCGDDIDIIDGWPTGVVRVSFGKDSTWEDLDSLVTFVKRVFVATELKTETSRDSSPRQVVVEEQYIFPIKSCAAQRVPLWTMNTFSSRLSFDREFALVDVSGVAMRLQRYPRMAFIEPSILLDENKMTVRANGMPPLEIGLDSPKSPAYGEGVVRVCGNICSGVLWGDRAVSKWFSDFLGVQCWLARFSEGDYKLPSGVLMKKGERRVAFANEQPLLLISKHAVDLLNDVLESQNDHKVTSRHFRPNFVVKAVGPIEKRYAHSEDLWKHVVMRDQNISFDVVGQCARCSMVDVDPRSGAKGHTLRALADYRRTDGRINFGIYIHCSKFNGAKSVCVKEGDVLSCE